VQLSWWYAVDIFGVPPSLSKGGDNAEAESARRVDELLRKVLCWRSGLDADYQCHLAMVSQKPSAAAH
jgi:hypothetical protein